jgi:Glycosyltransferase 61
MIGWKRSARCGCARRTWTSTVLLSSLVVVTTFVSVGLHTLVPAVVDDIVGFSHVNHDHNMHDSVKNADRQLLRRQRSERRLDWLRRLSARRVREAKGEGSVGAPELRLQTYPPGVQRLREKWVRRRQEEEILKSQRGNFPTYNLSSLRGALLQAFADPSTSSCVLRDEDGRPLAEAQGRNGTERSAIGRSNQDFVGVCVRDELDPPFAFQTPRFLPNSDHEELFLLQPENRAALLPNFTDWSYKTCAKIPLSGDGPREGGCIVGRIEAHDVWSFQHFHDIGLPLVMQHRRFFDALQQAQSLAGCRPYPVHLSYDPPHNSKVLHEEWNVLGFPTNQSSAHRDVDELCGGCDIIAATIIKGMSLHPSHVLELRSRLFPAAPGIGRQKVVWISRNQGPGTPSPPARQRRQVSNEPEVVSLLRRRLPGLEVLNPLIDNVDTLEGLRHRLGDACMIVGVHGGQMYNQFFAGTGTAVLELLPLSDDPGMRGMFHGQGSPDATPGISHRAIWFNADLIGQPYWRLYFTSIDARTFNITRDLVDQILEVVDAAGCA